MFEYYLPFFLKEIKNYRNKGLWLFKYESNVLNLMTALLEIEAEVMSIINVSIYEYFEKNTTPSYYINKNKSFVFVDYLGSVKYYAKDFEHIFFLAKFYIKN